MSIENTPAQTPAPAANELSNGAAPVATGVAVPETQQLETPEAPNAEPAETPEHRKASYRFSELSKQKHAAEVRAAKAEGIAEAMMRMGQNAPTPAPAAAPAAVVDPEPNPEDFTGKNYDPEYLKAVARWEGRQAVKQATSEATAQAAEAQAFEAGRTRFIDARTKAEQVEASFPEYAGAVAQTLDQIARAEGPGPNRLIDVVTQTENPEWIAAAFATKPGLYEKILRMHPVARSIEIGRIDAQISANLRAQPAPVPQPAPPTPAVIPNPAATPPATLSGRGAAAPIGNPPVGDMVAYRAWRQRAFE